MLSDGKWIKLKHGSSGTNAWYFEENCFDSIHSDKIIIDFNKNWPDWYKLLFRTLSYSFTFKRFYRMIRYSHLSASDQLLKNLKKWKSAVAKVECLRRVHLHFTKLWSKQPSRVKPLLTFGSGAGSMSHSVDGLPLAANAGLSWVSAAVWGGGKWVFVRDRGNSFLFFSCLCVCFEGRRSFAALKSSAGGVDADSRWFLGSWSMALCVFESAVHA